MSKERREVGMMQVSDVLSSVVNPLREIVDIEGRANTVFHLGLSQLQTRATRLGASLDAVAAIKERAMDELQKGVPLCESPIECMALAALITLDWPEFLTVPPIVHDARNDPLLPIGDLIIVPQMALLRHRLDFGIVADFNGRRRIIGIECDGEAYHQNAERERARDRYMHSWDIPVFHLTGSEIHADAMAAVRPVALQFVEWCQSGADQLIVDAAA